MQKMIALLLLVVIFTSCEKEQDLQNDQQTYEADNVAYANVSTQQKMDIYLPSGRSTTNTKVLVLIHGGGWTGGDKNDFNTLMAQIKQTLPGYAIFNLNYRLASGTNNRFPAQEEDVKAAIQFIWDKRADYKISEKFVFLGASAGGHLALLQGYKYNTPVKPKAIVSFFGPTQLADLYNSNAAAAFIMAGVTGGTPSTHASIYTQSSPVTFVNAQSPPTIFLQGGIDDLVPPSQSITLQSALVTAGVANQYVFYPNEGHGWTGSNLNDSFLKIKAFLQVHVP